MAIQKQHPAHREAEASPRELILRLGDWVRYLLSQWHILLLAGLIGGGLGLAYSIFKKKYYTATTTFVVESGEQNGNLARYAGMAAMVGIDLGSGGGGLFQGDNILQLYKSRTMLEKALLSPVKAGEEELLIERYIAYKKLHKKWKRRPELLALDFRQDPASQPAGTRRLRDSVITTIVKTVNEELLQVAKPNKKLSLIKVDVVSPDEVFAKSFNETIVETVNTFYLETKTKRFTENIAVIQHMVDSVREVMTGAIYSAVKVADATPNLNPTRQVQRMAPAQREQFEAEANKTILGQLVQNLELTRLTLMQEQPLIQLVDHPVHPLQDNKTGKAKGIVIGGLLLGFLTFFWLILRKYFRDLMQEK